MSACLFALSSGASSRNLAITNTTCEEINKMQVIFRTTSDMDVTLIDNVKYKVVFVTLFLRSTVERTLTP